MKQSALLNSICYFSYLSFLHFPISEHEKVPQIKYVTFDHVRRSLYTCLQILLGFLNLIVMDEFVTPTLTFITTVMQFKNTDWRWRHYDRFKTSPTDQRRNTPEELYLQRHCRENLQGCRNSFAWMYAVRSRHFLERMCVIARVYHVSSVGTRKVLLLLLLLLWSVCQSEILHIVTTVCSQN